MWLKALLLGLLLSPCPSVLAGTLVPDTIPIPVPVLRNWSARLLTSAKIIEKQENLSLTLQLNCQNLMEHYRRQGHMFNMYEMKSTITLQEKDKKIHDLRRDRTILIVGAAVLIGCVSKIK